MMFHRSQIDTNTLIPRSQKENKESKGKQQSPLPDTWPSDVPQLALSSEEIYFTLSRQN